MGKMEFDVRVEILKQQLEFLRCLHEAVSMSPANLSHPRS